MRKAVIVLPTYNEAKNIPKLIENIFAIADSIKNWDLHILVVDSNSPDNTADLVDQLQKRFKKLHLLRTEKEGLGKAYVRGFEYALKTLDPYVLFEMDADHSHNPKKIPDFLTEIENGADFVIGSRYMKGGAIPEDWGIHRKFLSFFGNWIIRLGFMNLKITEWTNGFRAIKSWVLKDSLIDLQNYTGYVFQVALVDHALKMKEKIKEIPIKFIDRTEGISKINSGQYTFQTLWYVFTHSSFVKFGIVGGIGFIIDFGISYLFIVEVHTAVWLATIISAETAIISNFLFNNFWSFKHKKLDHKSFSLLWNFLKFNLIASGSILIQTVTMEVTTNTFGRHYWYIYKMLIIAFVIIPYSYLLYNKIIWKDN
jgi:dolichol-phosphate mannosyltransferase